MTFQKILTHVLILTLFLTSNSALAAGYAPADCKGECTCYTMEDLEKISKELSYAAYCRFTLTEYERFAESNNSKAKNLELWQEPSMVIGGLVLTAGVFGLLGYVLGSRK